SASSAMSNFRARKDGGIACTARTTATAAPTSSPNASSDGARHEPDHGRTGRHRPMDRHTPTGTHRLRHPKGTIMQHQLDAHEAAIAGQRLDDAHLLTMPMLVWYVVTRGAIAGAAVILWATWQVIQWIAG